MFLASVLLTDGLICLHWEPDLTGAVPVRVYSVFGVSNLVDGFPLTPATNVPAGTRVPVQSLAPYRFFKIGVELHP